MIHPIFPPALNDFGIYYKEAQWLVQNPLVTVTPQSVYPNQSITNRYFPTILLLLFPLTQLPLIYAYGVFIGISVCANIINMYLTLAILRKITKKAENPLIERCVVAFFLLPFNIDFYVQGQISCILGLTLLLSLYFYLDKREVLGSVFLGLSMVILPICFFQIFFVLLAALSAKDLRMFFKRVVFIFSPPPAKCALVFARARSFKRVFCNQFHYFPANNSRCWREFR